MRTLSAANVCLVLGGLLAVTDCGGSSGGMTGQGGAQGGAGKSGGAGAGTPGTAGMTGVAGAGMMGMAGKPGPGMTGMGGAGGTPTVAMCTPGVKGAFITDCGYPVAGGTMLATVVFNEDEVL